MTFPPPVWRVLLRAGAALLLTGGTCAHAEAGEVIADLNADGILDRIQIENTGSSATVRLVLSGQPCSIVFRAKEPLASIRAADLDRDGHLDLVALSTAHHLWTWRNTGRGTFHPGRKRVRRLLAVHHFAPRWQPRADPAPRRRDELGSATPVWNESLPESTPLCADIAAPIRSRSIPLPALLLGVASRAPPFGS